MTNGSSWQESFEANMQQLFAGQKELQESHMKLRADMAELKDIVLANAEQIKANTEQISSLGDVVSNLMSVTSDLTGYSITQSSDIQTNREDLLALKRRLDTLDGGSSS